MQRIDFFNCDKTAFESVISHYNGVVNILDLNNYGYWISCGFPH